MGPPLNNGWAGPPSNFFEFDGTSLNPVSNPPTSNTQPTYEFRMLLLPTGQVLVSNGSKEIYVYTPDGQPNPAWRPTIISCPTLMVVGQTYSITGTQFNGLSQACSYGDDAQMATNYPIVQLTNLATGVVTFLRIFNHSTMAVATGNTTQSTNMQVPVWLAPGKWNLVVIANGIPSDAVQVQIVSPSLVHMETVNLGGTFDSLALKALADVYPFHIIGGQITISHWPTVPGNPDPFQVLAAEIIDNKIQAAVSLEFNQITPSFSSGTSLIYVADLAQTITGNNPISGNTNETVSHITHLLLFNDSGSGWNFEVTGNVVVAMTIIYSLLDL